MEISDVLNRIEEKNTSFRNDASSDLDDYIVELKDLLNRERNDYNVS